MATYIKIASSTVGLGGVASVTFSSIPATYTDLLVKVSARTSRTGFVNDSLLLQFNGSAANFTFRSMYQINNSPASVSGSTNQATYALDAPGATANTFSSNEIYILNYASSASKSVNVDSVSEDNNSAGPITEMRALLWSNSAAINSIGLFPETGPLFVQYSTFTLYGISNA